MPVAVKLNVAAGREAGADVCRHAAAALQRGDSRIQSNGIGVRSIGLALGIVPSVALGLAVGVAEQFQRGAVALAAAKRYPSSYLQEE